MADVSKSGLVEGHSSCCVSGHLRDGKGDGTFEEIAGRRTYVARSPDGSKAKTIIYITDIYGVELVNHHVLADIYAKAGFHVVIPDVLDGDAISLEYLNVIEPRAADAEKMTDLQKTINSTKRLAAISPWAIKHREAVARPIIESFIAEIRKDPEVSKIGIVGFCWGGRHAILQAREGSLVDAAAAMHPSFMEPADFEPISKPITMGFAERDSIVGKPEVDAIIDVMEKKTNVDKEIRIYPKQVHGFSVRGDYSYEDDREAMDGAAKQVVDWFTKYLA